MDQAETDMLELYVQRANLKEGQRVLELGCGWGSFTLFYASKFRKSTIVGVSNSNSQREYIMGEAAKRGLSNIEVITCDVNNFDGAGGNFDRVVSIEMFEHVRNYRALLRRVATWLKDDEQSRLFVHIFTHKYLAYPFEDTGRDTDWMAREFFSKKTKFPF